MLGPNVNWQFLEHFQSELKRNSNVTLMHVGSCGLHVVNVLFRIGLRLLDWKLTGCYQVHTGCLKTHRLDVKFCKHRCDRWLEKVPVCERIIEMLPDLRKYMKPLQKERCQILKPSHMKPSSSAVQITWYL